MRATIVVVNCRTLQHNLQRLRELASASKMAAVMKTSAYGHGLLETARMLPGADAFGVARLEEALRLRVRGVIRPTSSLEGFFDARDLPTVSVQHFHTTAHSEEQLAMLEEISPDEPIIIWVKLDTGMHCLGVRLEQAETFYYRLAQCRNVRQPVDIVSHFARADEPKCGAIERQLAIFNTFCEGKSGQRFIAVSGGILLQPQPRFDWVRPGIILYGVSPLEDRSTGADFGCQPVMSLIFSPITVREHEAGGPVGCGGAWVDERGTHLGVVVMGYGDGYPRVAPSDAPVLVNGREVPIVGRVAMNMICVDLDLQTQDRAGDPVTLWGEDLPIERIAEITKVNTYELTTRLILRVAMKYVDQSFCNV